MKFEVEFILNHNDLIPEDAQPARFFEDDTCQPQKNAVTTHAATPTANPLVLTDSTAADSHTAPSATKKDRPHRPQQIPSRKATTLVSTAIVASNDGFSTCLACYSHTMAQTTYAHEGPNVGEHLVVGETPCSLLAGPYS